MLGKEITTKICCYFEVGVEIPTQLLKLSYRTYSFNLSNTEISGVKECVSEEINSFHFYSRV